LAKEGVGIGEPPAVGAAGQKHEVFELKEVLPSLGGDVLDQKCDDFVRDSSPE